MSENRPSRQSTLQWVPADELHVNPVAQRAFRPAWAQTILGQFDLDKFQAPHVNRRSDGTMHIMEGQHGTWAYRQHFGEGKQVQAWLYEGLTEEQEAEFFLSLNNKKAVDSMARFKVAVIAGRPAEADIDRIVRSAGCVVGDAARPNNIAAVAALLTIYNRHGAEALTRTLRIIGSAFVEGGYERPILLGISMVFARYPEADEERLIGQLAAIRNGWKGIIQRTTLIREQMDATQSEAAAAAVVEFYNKGRGGQKLPTWWKGSDA